MLKMAKNSDVTKEEQTEIISFLADFTHDPVGFVYASFPWGEGELKNKKPSEWQLKLLAEIGEGLKTVDEVVREAVASGHGIGKSALVSWIILWAISTHEDARGVVTANTDTQLKSKTWSELAKWHRLFIGKALFKYTATSLFSVDNEHEKTWRIDAIPWSDTNPEAFAGLHNEGKRILVIFDEASAISDKIWEVTEGALTDANTEIVWCAFGNPTRNSGRFFDCFHKYRRLWKSHQVDSRTVAISNKKQLQEWVDTYGEDSDFVRVRVKGLFPNSSVMQFISTKLVGEAQQRNLHPTQFDFAPTVIGVDPSWTGEDEFVIYLRQGLFSKRLGVYQKNDDDIRMAGIIANFEDEYNADAVNVDMGYGTGIVSAGRTMGRSWLLVPFGGESSKEGYANKRSEMWGDMKDWLKDGGVIEDDNVLRDDLIGPEAFINLKGKIQLESKDSMKKRGIPSPNRADALALTFARAVVKNKFKRKRAVAKTSYNPF